jgi:4'-phosphopantetheinyl transferase
MMKDHAAGAATAPKRQPRRAHREPAIQSQDADAAVALDLYLLHRPEPDPGAVAVAELNDQERERASSFVRERDRVLYSAAHVALRRLLGRELGRPARTVEFARLPCPGCGKPHGRPVLAAQDASAAAPYLPALDFSLSHGGEVILIGLAATTLGVDVEPQPEPDVINELIVRLHPEERAELAAAGDRMGRDFADLWTRKEAYLKGLGIGLGRDLRLDYLGTGTPALRPPVWTVANLAPEHLAAAPGHSAAYALAAPVERVTVHQLTPDFVR